MACGLPGKIVCIHFSLVSGLVHEEKKEVLVDCPLIHIFILYFQELLILCLG